MPETRIGFRRLGLAGITLALVVLLNSAVQPSLAAASLQQSASPIPITQARAAADGTQVTIQGTVNAAPDTFDTKNSRFYIQDSSAGIAVYYGAGGLPGLALGDVVKVSGKLNTYKAERELDPAALSDLSKVGHGDPPAPRLIKTNAVNEAVQGVLVTLSGKVTGTQNGFTLNDGSGDAHIFIYSATGIKAAVSVGQDVTVTGIGSVYNGQYEVDPRSASDIVASGGSSANNASPGATAAPTAGSTALPGPRERGAEPAKQPLDSDAQDAQLEIAAVYAATDEATVNEQGEAVRLYNSGDSTVNLNGWTLTDNIHAVRLDGIALAGHKEIWLARNAARFKAEFGFAPGAEYGQCDNTVPCLSGTPLALDNQGDDVALLSPKGVVDRLAYGDGYADESAWNGPAVQPYRFADYVPAAGQIFYRKLDPASCLPVAANTHQASDWAQDPNDPKAGRHILFPGWNVDQFCDTAKGTDNAITTFLVAPDNSFSGLAAAIDKAQSEIDIELYFITSPAIVDHLTAAQGRGVKIRAFFDGQMSGDQQIKLPKGTVEAYLQTFWAAQEIVGRGGEVNFWAANTALQPSIPRRYNVVHQKFLIIDHQQAVISTENFAETAFPDMGSPTDTSGNRGAVVITTSRTVVRQMEAIFAADDNLTLSDVIPWQGVSQQFSRPSDNAVHGYKPIQPQPLTISGATAFEVVQSPENSLNTQDGLIGMVAKAGKGDRVLVEQQYEDLYWGAPTTYLNPRLQAYIDAARRGANVQIILDGVNSASSNTPTVAYLKKLASGEHLALDARITPANGVSGNSFHVKFVLITVGSDGYVHIGSLNGSENSSRYNREVAVQVESRQAFDYYAKVFDTDWQVSAGQG